MFTVLAINQQHDYAIEHVAWVVLAQNARQATTRHHSNSTAHLLDGHHERKHPERQPQLAVAELCAGLAVGCDA